MTSLADLADTRNLFFTGKGGVGKTSAACATSVALADAGRRILLVSTDPASNLDEVLGVSLSTSAATPIPMVPGLSAMNIDPEAAARAYRERVVGPYRGVLPPATVANIEEQLSGACTVEIAAFDQFASLLGSPSTAGDYDHIVFDTAPTGHTLRLLELPAAWTTFFDASTTGTSCLGPLSGLDSERKTYEAALDALRDANRTRVLLVARPERAALREAGRTADELGTLGITNLSLIINGVFRASEPPDRVATAMAERARRALASMPAQLASLVRVDVPLFARAPMGIAGLRALASLGASVRAGEAPPSPTVPTVQSAGASAHACLDFDALVSQLASGGHGVILTMGKGGVGKTTVAVSIARALSRRGHRVRLTTTDPAAHLDDLATGEPGLSVSRIDPHVETASYTAHVMATAGAGLDEAGRALLAEDLRSPCTEEIAVFQSFARVVADGTSEFVVIDTAPTGHTLLLLDAAEAYHREVLRSAGAAPEAVRELLPRLRDPAFARVILVTLPEATPVHEAAHLQSDLQRAGISPFAWVINQSLTPLTVRDPVLVERQHHEGQFIAEVERLTPRTVLMPWSDDPASSFDATTDGGSITPAIALGRRVRSAGVAPTRDHVTE